MTNPFLIEGPALISFSGGRTSGVMLRRILDAGLRPDVHVLFSNTGKERKETLDFVHEVETRWSVPIHWLERERDLSGEERGKPTFREVTYETASRNGEPFAQLIGERNFLPNPVMRFCTQELKVRVMRDFMRSKGYETWTNVIGLRADEPRRVANGRAGEGREVWSLAYPLFDAGVTRNDVLLFWKKQPFDLQLRSWEGNCDLCFLKGQEKRTRIMEDRPDLAAWWMEQEARIAARPGTKASAGLFRGDTPSYASLLKTARSQVRMFPNEMFDEQDPTDLGDCVCVEAA